MTFNLTALCFAVACTYLLIQSVGFYLKVRKHQRQMRINAEWRSDRRQELDAVTRISDYRRGQ